MATMGRNLPFADGSLAASSRRLLTNCSFGQWKADTRKLSLIVIRLGIHALSFRI